MGMAPGTRTNRNPESWALFTHNTLELQNDFELTLGLRYTVEDKSMTANLRSTDQVCLPFSQQFLGSLQANQAYFGWCRRLCTGTWQAYAAQLQGLVNPDGGPARRSPTSSGSWRVRCHRSWPPCCRRG